MLHVDTTAVMGDRGTTDESGVVPAIHYSAVFAAADESAFARMSSTPRHPRNYTRYGNPVHERIMAIMAELEGTETALVTGSGMGAMTTTLLALLGAGDHVVAQTQHYMSTSRVLDTLLGKLGVKLTLVDATDPAAMAAALRENTRVIVMESPANPTLALTDIGAVTALARANGILTVADNTFATPLNQRPADLGVDVVVHSATKYLGGHHDLTGGVICTSHALAERIWLTHLSVGSVLSPMDAWLLLRGLRTLPLRMERVNANALALAQWLCDQAKVRDVVYPGLESHPQFALASQQMNGFGGVLTFRVRRGEAAAKRALSALRIPLIAASLGGVNSLAIHVATLWHGTLKDAASSERMPSDLIRYAVGIEHIDDLKRDLMNALRSA